MPSIQETFQPKADNDAQRELFRNVMNMNNSFWNSILEIFKVNDGLSKLPRYYNIERIFSNTYNVLTKQYRELYHQTKNSAVGLYNKQFNKKTMLEQLLSVHPEYQVVKVNNYQKLRYHINVLGEVLKEQLNLMYAIYGNNLSKLQIQTSITKVMIDYFQPGDVNWVEASDVVRQFLSQYDVEDMAFGAQFYGTKPVKKRNTGMKYTTKNSGAEYTIKMLLDQGMKKTQICRELNMPRQTLYDIIKRYNLDKPIAL